MNTRDWSRAPITRRATLAAALLAPALARAQERNAMLHDLARRAAIYLFPYYEMYRTRWNATVNEANPVHGKLKPIASTGGHRSPAVPEAPTFVEAGFPDLVVTSWSLWAVPAGTPGLVRDKLRAATERALKEPDVIESMQLGGFEPGAMSVADADAFIRTEYKRWGEVIRAAGIKRQ